MLSPRERIVAAYLRGYRVDASGTIFGSTGKRLAIRYRNGYQVFGLKGPLRKAHSVAVHRFAAYCKYGDALFGDGIVVRHLNGKPWDNALDNLALGTSHDNAMDIPAQDRHKRSLPAGRVLRSLSDEQMVAFISDRRAGMKLKPLCDKYSLPKSTAFGLIARYCGQDSRITFTLPAPTA